MTTYESAKTHLKSSPRTWLITGVAGFIGSNLLEVLLGMDQRIVGLDNFATCNKRNLDEVRDKVTSDRWNRFNFIEGDICELETCQRACADVDYVLHHAAIGSVPWSIEDPIKSNAANVTGFLNMAVAARDHKVKRFVYAASSSTYGDDPGLPKVEEITGRPLSPYAVTKLVNELYADVFGRCYGLETVGLRYFNVFGPRQDPEGPYAAVIPRWVASMIRGKPVHINGDGETSRDFCFVGNAIQSNILAAIEKKPEAVGQVYNVAVGVRTSLNELYEMLRERLLPHYPELGQCKPEYLDFREGDVMHSQASIEKAKTLLGYRPTHLVTEGIEESLEWYIRNL